MRFSVLLGVTACFVLAPSAYAQLAPEWKFCNGEMLGTSDVRLTNCTALIQSRREGAGDKAIAYNNRGIAYRSLGNPARAIEDYRRALALDQTYRDAYNNLGLALSDLGEFAAAVHAYTQAITIDARDWHAYNNRGLALWALGRREDARRDYEKVKELIGG